MPPLAADPLTHVALRLAAVVLLVLANAGFVAAEFALVASRRTRLQAMARKGDRQAALAEKAQQSLTRYISGTQLGITLTSLGLGWIGEPALAAWIQSLFEGLPLSLAIAASHTVAVVLAFVFITFLHVVLGELTPKAFALLYPEAMSRWLAPPLMLFTTATNPFIWLLNSSATGIVKLFGGRAPSERERVHSPEEIKMLVEQSRKTGSLDALDARFIAGVFEFSEKTAREVMTPRTRMVALADGLSVEAAADEVARAGRSRYPVYRESLDDIVGTVHAKEILRALRGEPGRTVAALLRPALFVPGTREVEDVLADMKRQKVHLAIVLDEFGGTAGLVTMEDLLEEIVGQIYDEYDRPESAPAAAGAAPTFAGAAELRDVSQALSLELLDPDYTTIGGYLFGRLGRLPKVGDQIPVPGAVFEVVEMEGRRVGRVKLVRKT
ncbi:MAG TPA: hemolysin family protein [Gemmatimonadales bacterium]|nr:hemolysin family protein [Gemmatimonadales bacterium]